MPSLFSRIISLVDVYDALGRPRVYRQKPFVSEKIIALLLEQSGKEFDPALVKIFINTIGIYPLGTLVLLNTGEMGIITQIPEDVALINRPRVLLLIREHDGYRRGPTINLADIANDGIDYTRSIIRTLDPNEYRINVEEYFSEVPIFLHIQWYASR